MMAESREASRSGRDVCIHLSPLTRLEIVMVIVADTIVKDEVQDEALTSHSRSSVATSTQGSPHLRRHHRRPVRPSEELQTELLKGFEKNCLEAGQKFLPADKLNLLITEQRIEKVLSEVEEIPSNLPKFILEKAKKTFAMLVCNNKVSTIKDVYEYKFTDDQLPVAMEEDCTGDFSATSYHIGSDSQGNGKSWWLFDGWSYKEVTDFIDLQWNFLAPFFSKSQFEYNLYPACPLPFIKRGKELHNGAFSTVYEVEICPAHIDFLKAVGHVLTLRYYNY